jgi:hypothetical protein
VSQSERKIVSSFQAIIDLLDLVDDVMIFEEVIVFVVEVRD